MTTTDERSGSSRTDTRAEERKKEDGVSVGGRCCRPPRPPRGCPASRTQREEARARRPRRRRFFRLRQGNNALGRGRAGRRLRHPWRRWCKRGSRGKVIGQRRERRAVAFLKRAPRFVWKLGREDRTFAVGVVGGPERRAEGDRGVSPTGGNSNSRRGRAASTLPSSTTTPTWSSESIKAVGSTSEGITSDQTISEHTST